MVAANESRMSVFISVFTVVTTLAVGIYAHLVIQNRVRRGLHT